jgi:hypothetical protein
LVDEEEEYENNEENVEVPVVGLAIVEEESVDMMRVLRLLILLMLM